MARRLVVCADGTWNTKDQEDEGQLAPTNVVKIYEAVRRRPVASDGTQQLAFYHEGIGSKPNVLERGLQHVADALHLHSVNRNLFAGATGEGIDRNIKDCYRWLVRHYVPGDEIYLFGFSRGAYTVRSLAGLIRNSGLLTDHNEGLIDKAYELYRDRSDATSPKAKSAVEFRRLYAHDADVTCIGVWDTVGALGLPLPVLKDIDGRRYAFHDVTLSSHVRHAYHAVAIDEERVPFSPTLWEQQPDAPPSQRLEQTWFPGVHCNVGGGYADCGLSDTTFLWMIERAGRAGLEVDTSYVEKVACNCSPHGVLRDSMDPIYKPLGRYVRPIAAGRTAKDGAADLRRESVHASAWDRWGKEAPARRGPYQPDNLADYRRRFPPAGA